MTRLPVNPTSASPPSDDTEVSPLPTAAIQMVSVNGCPTGEEPLPPFMYEVFRSIRGHRLSDDWGPEPEDETLQELYEKGAACLEEDSQEASLYLNEAVKRSPLWLKALNALGCAHRAFGLDPREAELIWQRVATLTEEGAIQAPAARFASRANLANLYHELAEKAQEPGISQLYLHLANAAYRQAAAASQQDRPELLARWSRVVQQLGDQTSAVTLLRRAKQADAENQALVHVLAEYPDLATLLQNQ